MTTGPLSGFRQAKAVCVVLSDLSAEAPGGHECPTCAVHPLGESGPSATHTEGVKPSRRGDSSRHRDNDCAGMGLTADQVVNPSLPILGGATPHVVQSRAPVGNLPGGDCHNVGVQTIIRDPCGEGLQGSGALVSGPPEWLQQRGKVACHSKGAPPRGALPVRAEMCQEFRRHGHVGEAEGRGVGQLVEEVTSREDPGEDMEGFPWCGTEGAGDEANALIKHELGPGAKGTILARGGPQLAAVQEDRKANRVEDEAPVGHRQAAVCVAQDLEGFERSTGSIAHDGDVRFPVEAEMKKEAQVAHNRFRGNPIICVGSLIHEVQSIRGGVAADTRGAKVDELCLGRLRGEIVAEEPLVTEPILLTKKGVDRCPGGGLGKNDAIVDVHAQSGLRGRADMGKEGGGVQGGEDGGERRPLRGGAGLG